LHVSPLAKPLLPQTQAAIDFQGWVTFEQMLDRLHRAGLYIHPDQLVAFLLAHGLPVHLRYVPDRLRQKAIQINDNYQGDMAQLIEEAEPYRQSL
jgi:hypothetical protein